MTTDTPDERISIGADVDVREIMEEVRAEVARKRRQGMYPPEVLEELETVTGTQTADDLLALSLMRVRQSAGFSTAVTTASQMGLAAPIASSFKRVVRGSVRWYMVGVLQQVEEFAANIVHTVSLLAERVRLLDSRLSGEALREELSHVFEESAAELRAWTESMRASAEEVAARIESLENVRARDRLPILERSMRGLRERIEGEPAADTHRPATATDRSDRADRAVDYLDFENCFRGSEEDIKSRQQTYVELFRDLPGPVVDLGCGRGEFLGLLAEADISAYGVDRHPDMVARCREQGLDGREGDALEHLESVPAGTLGGVFSAQMIEHLDVRDVPRMFELAAEALAPGGRLVVETINPQSLFVFSAAFYVDLGHLRPLHPFTLRFLAEKAGFAEVRVEYFSPPPGDLRPQQAEPVGEPVLDALISTVNENFRRLDDVLFGPQDYAIVATR